MKAEALKLPRGIQILSKRGDTQEVKDTFLMVTTQEHTFRDLVVKAVEYPLRLSHSNLSMGKLYATHSHTEKWPEPSRQVQERGHILLGILRSLY